MSLYVFSSSQAVDARQCAQAEQTVAALGGTVVKSLAGVLLVELDRQVLAQVARLLPGWHWSPQRKTAQAPEHRLRERTRARHAQQARARG